jgi:hypothetical protein
MPINYDIDNELHLVRTRAHDVLKDEEVFNYQKEVWSRSEVAGYDEIIDMSEVTEIEFTSTDRFRELASLSASMDSSEHKTKLAIVAPVSLYYGLARMYQSFREFTKGSNKEINVFHSQKEAMEWLGKG